MAEIILELRSAGRFFQGRQNPVCTRIVNRPLGHGSCVVAQGLQACSRDDFEYLAVGVARGQKRCDIIVQQPTASINDRRSVAQRFEFGVRDWLVVAYRLDHVGARATVSPVRRTNDVVPAHRLGATWLQSPCQITG